MRGLAPNLLCALASAGTSTSRCRATISGSGGAGTRNGLPSEDLNARWTAFPTQNPGAGATLRAQFWYRDPAGASPRRTHLSDAVELVVAP